MSRDSSSHTFTGISAHGNARQHNGNIYGSNVYTNLHDDFKARDKPSKFFKVGRVFLVLWTEPTLQPESNTGSSRQHQRIIGSGEYVYTKVRRFVVVREGHRSCTCISIATYNGQGVGKHGVKKSDHAIVYTGKLPPDPFPSELPSRGEQGMRQMPIRVLPDIRDDQLDPASRINFGRAYTLDHNLKVKAFGLVHPDSLAWLRVQFSAVFVSSAAERAPQQSALQGTPRNASIETSDASGDEIDNAPMTELAEEDDSWTPISIVPPEVRTMIAAQLADRLREVDRLLGQVLANADDLLEHLERAQKLFREWIRTTKIILPGFGTSQRVPDLVSLPLEAEMALDKLEDSLKKASATMDSKELSELENQILRDVETLRDADYSETRRTPNIGRDDVVAAESLHQFRKNQVAGESRVHYGHVYNDLSRPTGTLWRDNKATDMSRVMNGDMYGGKSVFDD